MIEESTGWGSNCHSGQMWVPPFKVNEIIAFKITKSVFKRENPSLFLCVLCFYRCEIEFLHQTPPAIESQRDSEGKISRTMHVWKCSPKDTESNRPLDKIIPFLLAIYANFQSVSTKNILDQMLSSLILVPKIWGTAFNLSQGRVVSWFVVT